MKIGRYLSVSTVFAAKLNWTIYRLEMVTTVETAQSCSSCGVGMSGNYPIYFQVEMPCGCGSKLISVMFMTAMAFIYLLPVSPRMVGYVYLDTLLTFAVLKSKPWKHFLLVLPEIDSWQHDGLIYLKKITKGIKVCLYSAG